MIDRLFEVTLVFSDHEKPYSVEVVIPDAGGVIDQSFRFSDFTDAVMLLNDYANTFRRRRGELLAFHHETLRRFQANELQFKMKV